MDPQAMSLQVRVLRTVVLGVAVVAAVLCALVPPCRPAATEAGQIALVVAVLAWLSGLGVSHL